MTSSKHLCLLTAVSVALIFSTGCGNKKENATAAGPARPKGLKAEGFVVNASSFQTDYTASGTLLANETIDIHPEISGRIVTIGFKEGARVKKGQVLLQLNDADLRAGLQKLRAQRALQEKILERSKELVRIGGISQQDYETTETQIASIDADIALQEADLRKTRIIAPFDGIVGLRSVSVGAIVSPTTVVAILQQLNPLKMDFTLPEQYYKDVKVGKQVFFTLGNETTPRSGTVAAIDPGADVTTRSIRVRAIVPNKDNNLVAGAFAQVRIPMESRPDALLIPSQSVIPTTREKRVAVIRNGKAELVPVRLGARTEEQIQVLQGLNPGDTILTTGIMQVKPGMEVSITRVSS